MWIYARVCQEGYRGWVYQLGACVCMLADVLVSARFNHSLSLP